MERMKPEMPLKRCGKRKITSSWYGLTAGVLVTGTEDISSLRTKVTPYVFPIPSDRIMSSGGVLSNDGYAIRNK